MSEKPRANGLPSPVTPANGVADEELKAKANGLPLLFDSPSRKVSIPSGYRNDMMLTRQRIGNESGQLCRV